MNLERFYKGCVFIRRINRDDDVFYTWVEIRYEPCHNQFKMRVNSFFKEDIDNGWDPNYDGLGQFQYFDSLNELKEKLGLLGLDINGFYDTSRSRYPL